MTTTQINPSELTSSVWALFDKFISQRSGLKYDNYGDVKAFRMDQRTITRDGSRAKKALGVAQALPFDGAALLEALQSVFAGRLSLEGDGGEMYLDYCTGQYFPTEYRLAAAVVLERYAEDARKKTTPGGKIPRNISELKDMAYSAGSHFFDRESMKFFRSRVEPSLYIGSGGVFFVTSEQGPSGVRRWTVRKFDTIKGSINTFGEFNEMTRATAMTTARLASQAPKRLCCICGGSGVQYREACWSCKGSTFGVA